jgi:catecholate siderophore receptor
VTGLEVANERIGIGRYAGLASEVNGVGFTSNGALPGQSIYAPGYTYSPGPFNPVLGGDPIHYNVDSGALYAMDTANWDDQIIVNGGVRWDNYGLRSSNAASVSRVDSDFVNYNGGIVYKPVPIGSIYAAYATSTNPFGSELDATGADYGSNSPTNTTILGPEQNKAAEVGTKWELFDRHLLVSGALFRTTKDNARETVAGVLTSNAAYQIQGIDIEASGKLTDRWSIFGGIVLMDSKVTKSNIAGNVGLPLANVAHQSFSLLSKYKFDGDWELGGQAVFRSKVYGGTFGANTGTLIPSYWRFDAFVEKKIDEHWTMKLYAQNLTNKLYYDTLYRSAAPFVAVAPGRAFYFITTAKF